MKLTTPKTTTTAKSVGPVKSVNLKSKGSDTMKDKGSFVGGAWVKSGKRGDYLSISVNLKELLEQLGVQIEEKEFKVNLFAFVNEKKKSENSPDYTLMYFEPRDKE